MIQSLLFSYTVILSVLFLLGVVAASYAGTTLALRREFEDNRP